MQGKCTNIIKYVDYLSAFKNKIQNWKRKIKLSRCSMFEELSSLFTTDNDDETVPESIRTEIVQHLTALEDEFERYFPEINGDELDLVRNPFRLQVEKIPDEYQDEFLELKMDSSAKDIFDEKSLTEFWPLMINSYPKVTEKALRALIPFVSTYLCESGFPTLLQIKSKQRNRLDVENDMRCALSKISPRIMDLVRKKQSQISH